MNRPMLALALSMLVTTDLLAYDKVTPPWSTTYDCAEWDRLIDGNAPDCDSLAIALAQACCGHGEQITAAANNPQGGGGRGQRHWQDTPENSHSGGLSLYFEQPQPELWVRWYMRYEPGYAWSRLLYDKWIYFYADTPSGIVPAIIPEWSYENQTRVANQNTTSYFDGDHGWTTTMGGTTGDGRFHYYELHIKMDTDGTDGIVELWVDDAQPVRSNTADLGTHSGWTHFNIGHNQRYTEGCRYVDFDDLAVSATARVGPLPAPTDDTPPSITAASPTGTVTCGE